MYYIVRRIDRIERYLRYIAAYNWATVLEIAVYAIVTALAESTLLPNSLTNGLAVAATFAILAYRWFITRVGLDVTRGAAAGIVLLGLVITILLNTVKTWLL